MVNLMGGGTGTLSVSPRSIQNNPFTIDAIDAGYNVEVIEKTLNLEVSNTETVTKSGVKGWSENEGCTTTFFGTGAYPDMKTSGGFLNGILSGHITVNTDYVSFTDETDGYCYLMPVTFQLQKIIDNSNNNKMFYIILELYGKDGVTEDLRSAERNYILNHNLVLFDNTRDDNASVVLRALKDDELDNYKFLFREDRKKIMIAEYTNTKELTNDIENNGLLEELFGLTSITDSMTLNYNYYYEEI